jgi:hypothetical protein
VFCPITERESTCGFTLHHAAAWIYHGEFKGKNYAFIFPPYRFVSLVFYSLVFHQSPLFVTMSTSNIDNTQDSGGKVRVDIEVHYCDGRHRRLYACNPGQKFEKWMSLFTEDLGASWKKFRFFHCSDVPYFHRLHEIFPTETYGDIVLAGQLTMGQKLFVTAYFDPFPAAPSNNGVPPLQSDPLAHLAASNGGDPPSHSDPVVPPAGSTSGGDPPSPSDPVVQLAGSNTGDPPSVVHPAASNNGDPPSVVQPAASNSGDPPSPSDHVVQLAASNSNDVYPDSPPPIYRQGPGRPRHVQHKQMAQKTATTKAPKPQASARTVDGANAAAKENANDGLSKGQQAQKNPRTTAVKPSPKTQASARTVDGANAAPAAAGPTTRSATSGTKRNGDQLHDSVPDRHLNSETESSDAYKETPPAQNARKKRKASTESSPAQNTRGKTSTGAGRETIQGGDRKRGCSRPTSLRQQMDTQVRNTLGTAIVNMERAQFSCTPHFFGDSFDEKTEGKLDSIAAERTWPRVIVGTFVYTEQGPNPNGGSNCKTLNTPELHMCVGSKANSKHLKDAMNENRHETFLWAKHDSLMKNVFHHPSNGVYKSKKSKRRLPMK